MKQMTTVAAAVSIAVVLSACGGGGDSAPAPTPPPPPTIPAPEGAYSGTDSTGYELTTINLENGSSWGIYGHTVNSNSVPYGLVQANGAYNSGSYAASDGRSYYRDGTVTAGTVSASYTSGGAFNGSVTSPSGTVTFVTNALSSTTFNYNQPASLASVAGTWTGSTLDGSGTTISVTSAGAVTGSSAGCAFTGTIAPRPSGKNVFNLTLTFANSAACAAPGQTGTGIAISYPLSPTKSKLVAGIQNAARTLGTAFIADNTPAPAPPSIPAPEGAYAGTTSTGYDITTINLENGSSWGIYGHTVNSNVVPYGLVQANGAYSNGNYAASDGRDYYWNGAVNGGTVSASYTSGGAFNGSVTSPSGTVTFVTNALPSTTFNYNQPASLASVAGTWTGSTLDGSGTTVSVTSAGAVTGSSAGCAFNGTIAPRPSGKNVFNLTLTFANSAACAAPGQTGTGIAVSYPLSPTKSQLVAGIQNAARTLGTAFAATR